MRRYWPMPFDKVHSPFRFRICVPIKCIIFAILGVHSALLAYSAFIHSATLNEPAHLAAGISNWQFGRFGAYCVNPPLVRMIAAAPVLLSGIKTDWRAYYEGPGARPEFALGEAFVDANGERAAKLFALARCACIPFSLAGGLICYCWARDLYDGNDQSTRLIPSGRRRFAGLLALALWCACPNILAHGALLTPDVGATALAVGACYSHWRWLREPTWWSTVCSGLVLGASQLTKTTLVVLFPLSVVLWAIYRCAERREYGRCDTRNETWCLRTGKVAKTKQRSPMLSSRWACWLISFLPREMVMLSVTSLIAVYVINLGYGFEGSFTRLEDFRFMSAALSGNSRDVKPAPQGGNRFVDTWLARLRVPLPKNYVLGIDLQKRDLEHYANPSYLRGEFSETGWWYYYLYALAIKVPLGTWTLVILAAMAPVARKILAPHIPWCQRTSWRDELIVVAPPMVILTFVSSQKGFSEHMRYVLPCFPFAFVWIGRLAVLFTREWRRSGAAAHGERHVPSGSAAVARRAVTVMALAAVVWSVGASMCVYPHSLSYFNELIGGPAAGPMHLINSNVDWGQDLLLLKEWLQNSTFAASAPRRGAPINLIYFGYFNPRQAGIDYKVPNAIFERDDGPIATEAIPPGWYALSATLLRGYPWFIYRPDGTKARVGPGSLVAFQKLKPVAMVGYSIYIYEVRPREHTQADSGGPR